MDKETLKKFLQYNKSKSISNIKSQLSDNLQQLKSNTKLRNKGLQNSDEFPDEWQ